MTKLGEMNLHKDVMVVLFAVLAASLVQLLQISPAAAMAQLDWAIEFSRLIHALTEPTAVAGIIATLGALARYEIWKRRLKRRHEQELEELRAELKRKRSDDDAEES